MVVRLAWLLALVCLLPAVSWAAAVETPFGRYHALVIGNNAYTKLPKLQTAVGDAEAVAQVLDVDPTKAQQVNKKPESPGFFLGQA